MWIGTIPIEQATGLLKREYNAAIRRAGRVWNIVRAMSLNAETLHASMRLYVATMKAPSGLTRAQREMIAAIVSQTNGCRY
jgi:alkylhydroperoxidase family enzyme